MTSEDKPGPWDDFKPIGETRGDRTQRMTWLQYGCVLLATTGVGALAGGALAFYILMPHRRTRSMEHMELALEGPRGPIAPWAWAGAAVGLVVGIVICVRIAREEAAERHKKDAPDRKAR